MRLGKHVVKTTGRTAVRIEHPHRRCISCLLLQSLYGSTRFGFVSYSAFGIG